MMRSNGVILIINPMLTHDVMVTKISISYN